MADNDILLALSRRRKERGQDSRGQPTPRGRQETRREAPRRGTSRKSEPPASRWKYILLIALTLGGGLPLLFQALERVWLLFIPRVVPLSVDRPEELYNVFFGGEPWLIVCSPRNDTVPPIIQSAVEIAGRYREPPFRVGLLDCNAKLPSGQSTVQRFSLSATAGSSELVFYVANGAKPQVVPMGYFTDPKEGPPKLVQLIIARTEKKASRVSSQAQLRSRCIDRKRCVVVLNRGKLAEAHKQTLEAVMKRHRATAFVLLDEAKYRLSLDAILPARGEGEPRVVFFQRNATGNSKGKEKQRQLLAAVHEGDFDTASLLDFLERAPNAALPYSKPITFSSSSSPKSHSRSPRPNKPSKPAKPVKLSAGKEDRHEKEGAKASRASASPRRPPAEDSSRPRRSIDPSAEPWNEPQPQQEEERWEEREQAEVEESMDLDAEPEVALEEDTDADTDGEEIDADELD